MLSPAPYHVALLASLDGKDFVKKSSLKHFDARRPILRKGIKQDLKLCLLDVKVCCWWRKSFQLKIYFFFCSKHIYMYMLIFRKSIQLLISHKIRWTLFFWAWATTLQEIRGICLMKWPSNFFKIYQFWNTITVNFYILPYTLLPPSQIPVFC